MSGGPAWDDAPPGGPAAPDEGSAAGRAATPDAASSAAATPAAAPAAAAPAAAATPGDGEPHGTSHDRADSHVPVMLAEVMGYLAPRPGEVVVDGTFGGGGYTRAILAAGAHVVAIDRDPAAISRGATLAAENSRLTLVAGRFGDLDAIARTAGHDTVDGVVLDIGVSSFQLDEGSRGFSFRFDGPLDMRMSAVDPAASTSTDGPTAADIVNHAEMSDLAHLLRIYGEERHAGAVARAIVAARPLTTTAELAAVCARTLRGPQGFINPATRTFQALRIAVNDELGELARGLVAAERLLGDGGRLVVVAFHSLEDRIVKRFLAARAGTAGSSRHMPVAEGPAASFTLLARKAVTASDREAAANPRARSAKLRAARRNGAPARPQNLDELVPAVRLKGVL